MLVTTRSSTAFVLVIALVLVPVAPAFGATLDVAGPPPLTAPASGHEPWRDTGVTTLATEALLDASTSRINEIRAPLLAVPEITTVGGSFRLELAVSGTTEVVDVGLVQEADASDPFWSSAWGGVPCGASWTTLGRGPSELWADDPDLTVLHVDVTVTAEGSWGGAAPCPVGPYTLDVILHDPAREEDPTRPAVWSDFQPDAVHLMEPTRYHALASGEAEPRFVVMADPQVGDPRAGEDGVADSVRDGSPRPFAEGANAVVGDGSDGENGRWNAFREAIRQARAEDPDFILFAGDLAFGQAIPGSYSVEYEELYALLREIRVPFYATIGNHDGYVSNGQDGYAYWRAYVGPLHYAKEIVPGTHVLSVNAYDWSEIDRMGFSVAVSAWGGQVREAQLAWVEDTLAGLRADHPDDRVIGLMHQSPSWRQDPYRDADPSGATEASHGVPVAEQVTRGVASYPTTDQGWTGEGRLELRDLLREGGVEMVFAGHTHRDRIARDDGAGRIVETHQHAWGRPDGYEPRDLHYWTRDDAPVTGFTQAELRDVVRTGSGPLYVDTTTPLSGTAQYFGYRVVDLEYDANGHLVLENLGVPLTEETLQAIARSPGLFNPEHADLGLFSKPLALETGAPWDLLIADA